jgi:DNA-binding response OmpR family regulator
LKKILIVEDDNSIAAIERDYLIANGYNVEIKADGKNGLNSALMGEYDLVLLDVMLPVIDGFEICRRVRSALKIPMTILSNLFRPMNSWHA